MIQIQFDIERRQTITVPGNNTVVRLRAANLPPPRFRKQTSRDTDIGPDAKRERVRTLATSANRDA